MQVGYSKNATAVVVKSPGRIKIKEIIFKSRGEVLSCWAQTDDSIVVWVRIYGLARCSLQPKY